MRALRSAKIASGSPRIPPSVRSLQTSITRRSSVFCSFVSLNGAGGADRGESVADRVAGFVSLKLVQERDAGRPGHGQRVAPRGDRDLVDPLGHGGDGT